MNHPCFQCGSEYMTMEATPEILEHTEGGPDFIETVRSFGGDPNDITIGYCPNCNERVLQGPVMSFEGTVSDSNN